MTDSDVFPFMDTFRSLTHVFKLKGDAHEIQDVGKSYFKALRKFTLAQVKDAAEKCLAECKHFPKPAEWADRVTRRIPVEIPELSPTETTAYLRAEAKRYEDDPCSCRDCQNAGVTHRFLRFVPEFDADGRDKHARIGERIVTRGHWAHGDELKRWYQARDSFKAQFADAMPGKSMAKKRPKESFQKRLEDIYAKKPEPVA